MLTALVTAGLHAKALTDARDISAAIRDLAGDPLRVPHWAIRQLVW